MSVRSRTSIILAFSSEPASIVAARRSGQISHTRGPPCSMPVRIYGHDEMIAGESGLLVALAGSHQAF